MKAIILAAGIGARLKPFTNKIHKSIIKIGKETIIHRLVRQLSKQKEIKEIIIVVGHKKEQIKKELKEFKITYVENPFYANSGNMFSLWLARHKTYQEVLLMDADIMIEEKHIRRLIDYSTLSVLLMDPKKKLDKEAVKIRLEYGAVKKIGKNLRKYNGEAVGIFKLTFNTLNELLCEFEISVEQHNDYTLEWEEAFNKIAEFDNIHTVKVKPKEKWIEIDFVEDVDRARKMFGGRK